MKRIAFLTGTVISFFIVLFFILTDKVDHTPYFETDYYKLSQAQTDSLKNSEKTVNDILMAGYAKVSITPQINQPATYRNRYNKLKSGI